MNTTIKQAVHLYNTCKVINIHTLDILNQIKNILDKEYYGFEQAKISRDEFKEKLADSAFTLIMHSYEVLMQLPHQFSAQIIREYDQQLYKINQLLNQYSFNQEQQQQLNDKGKDQLFDLAKRRAGKWLEDRMGYSVASTEICHVFTALQSAGKIDFGSNDIFYHPALSLVGLNPDVVNKKLVNSIYVSMNSPVDLLCVLIHRNIEDDKIIKDNVSDLKAHINNLKQYNKTFDDYLDCINCDEEDRAALHKYLAQYSSTTV